MTDARDEVAGELRGSLLEDLRARAIDAAEVARRAMRMGCDLSRGAVALVAEVPSGRPSHAVALITGAHPGALAQALGESDDDNAKRVYALLPAREGDDPPGETIASARRISARLGSLGPSAFSSFSDTPGELDRALAEAELMLDVIGRDERMAAQLGDGAGDGVYRLLFRAMASDPEELHRFYAETVEPLVQHDREYRTDLLGTLEAYLTNDCNMNATAREVFAHRHTVAHRLARIRELTSLDPSSGEDRERLGLGIKAYRIIEPTLRK
jgi:sugar diacid utilization regulator